MYCTKCGTQLNDGVEICHGCGCPTEYYNEAPAIVKTDSPIKLEILLICAAIVTFIATIISHVLFTTNSLPGFIYNIPMLLYIAQSILIIVFFIINIKLKSNLWKAASIITILGAVLLLVNDIQFALDYSDALDSNKIYLDLNIQYVIFRVMLFIGLALILISLNKIIAFTESQKLFRIIGICLSLAYIPWLLFIELPYLAIESHAVEFGGVLDQYSWTFHDLYQSFISLIKNDIVRIIGSIFFVVISIIFYKTKKNENVEY